MTKKQQGKSGLSRLISLIGTIIVVIAAIFGWLNEQGGEDGASPTVTPTFEIIDVTQVADVGSTESLVLSRTHMRGLETANWIAMFTLPTTSRNEEDYVDGIDDELIALINDVQSTLDIAAFEWNNPRISQAVVDAHNRGVVVRMVVDDEHTIEDHEELIADGEESAFQLIIDAGIPYRDDDRGGLMHNKFMIMDSQILWTGSMNFTMNGTYRNNNNVFVMSSTEAVAAYQAEFDEMFIDGEFGQKSSPVNGTSFSVGDVGVQVMFAPEDDPVSQLIEELSAAQSQIRFMTFSFTLDEVGQVILDRAKAGVDIEGIFEARGSRTEFSELPLLLCSGFRVFQDGNSGTFHHKVFIIDDHTVVTGSFNISENATNSNDENMVIIHSTQIAAQYLAEYARVRTQATVPPADEITCP